MKLKQHPEGLKYIHTKMNLSFVKRRLKNIVINISDQFKVNSAFELKCIIERANRQVIEKSAILKKVSFVPEKIKAKS